MSKRTDNFIYFCKYYFSDYLPSLGIEVLNHNETSHGTMEGVKKYYIANILYEGQELTITIDLEEFNNATSMHNMLEIVNKHTYNCMFMYDMDTHGTKDIDDFFKLMYF
ncbi:hypothetical protein VL14_ORF219 [Staphylococcus phage vB_SauM_VL14]|nr:hypothetical protein VL14_ORF219 [Staphylococcus phage vB_SauM_VL14]